MKIFQSIRWRLQLWHGVLLVAVLSGFGITAYQLEAGRLSRRIDEELRQKLPILVASQRPVRKGERRAREFSLSPGNAALFDLAEESGLYYAVWLRNGDKSIILSPGAPDDLPRPDSKDAPTRQRGDLREVYSFPAPGDCVLVGRSISADLEGLHRLGWLLGGVGAGVLLLGLIGGGWIVSLVLRPIDEISQTARKIATGDLTHRINTSDTDSELGQLAGVLNSTFSRLDAAFSQQARFSADAAHELRTPLAVILTHMENGIASECQNEEHAEAFGTGQRAARRMRQLIESLLELARLDAGQEPLNWIVFNLAQVTGDCVELLRPLSDERGIVLNCDLPEIECEGDPDRLAQVITNLLSNAIIHNQAGCEVRVTTSRGKGLFSLEISDNGSGIAPDQLNQIFDRFYRGDESRTGRTGGTGLGLAISKGIVEAHGGTLEVTSEVGVGTRFTISLPVGSEGG